MMQSYWKQILGAALIAAVAAGATALTMTQFWQTDAGAQNSDADKSAPDAVQHMELQAQFSGPLKDTVIQRWKDPSSGVVCYLYLPIVVQHSPTTPTGFVQYGANHIGSISCLPPR